MGRQSSKRDITSLSPELMLLVFNNLTPKDLATAALVCKQWCELTSDNQLWKKFLRKPRNNSFFKENQTPVKQLVKQECIVYIVGQPISCTRPPRLSEFYRQPLDKITEEGLMASFKSDKQNQKYPMFETEAEAKAYLKAINKERGGWIDYYPVIAKVCLRLGAQLEKKFIRANPVDIAGLKQSEIASLIQNQTLGNKTILMPFPHIQAADIVEIKSLKLEVNDKIYQHIYKSEQSKSRCILQ